MKLWALVILLGGCSVSEPKATKITEETKADLRLRAAEYCAMSKPKYEANFGNVEKAGSCDGALFTSLHGLLCDYVTVGQFESKETPGMLCRDSECRCFYKDYGSKSGFSKDMAIGMQTFLAYSPDPELAKRVVAYGEQEDWVVCEAESLEALYGRCMMSASIIRRWSQLVSLSLQRSEDAIGVNTGFQAHLDMVGIIADTKLNGGIGKYQKWAISEQSKRVPKNLLFRALNVRYHDANEGEAVAKALLKKFPAARLPNNTDWCEPYLWQREYKDGDSVNPDWLPCAKEHEHSGTDFLVAAFVLLN